jgi:hypothetical protein
MFFVGDIVNFSKQSTAKRCLAAIVWAVYTSHFITQLIEQILSHAVFAKFVTTVTSCIENKYFAANSTLIVSAERVNKGGFGGNVFVTFHYIFNLSKIKNK